MKQGLWERFINWMNPCVHSWQVIERLKDSETDATAVTLVRECTICGVLDTVTIEGPKRPPVPHVCPPHKWQTFHTVNLVDEKQIINGKPSQRGTKLLQQCDFCGDTRTRVVGLGSKDYDKYSIDPKWAVEGDEPEPTKATETKAA